MRIGNVELRSRVALAPMAGVTDAAFRQICAELGAAMTCTELISSKALCYRDKKTFTLLRQFPGEHPGAVQIFGSDPSCMAEAAQIALEATGCDIIDINIPQRSISVEISDEELANRRKEEEARGKEAFTPRNRNRVISKALRAYASMVTSADKGGVRDDF